MNLIDSFFYDTDLFGKSLELFCLRERGREGYIIGR